jgi:hypothetical protein
MYRCRTQVVTMNIRTSISALSDMLQAEVMIDASATHGKPGLYLFPWFIAPLETLRHSTPQRPLASAPAAGGFRIRLLVMVVPGLEAGELAQLDTARMAVLQQPVLNAGGERIEITLDPLGASELTAIFSAAGISLRMCIPVEIRA